MRKSEKRARGGARQAIYRQESIDSGLRAQKRDREREERRQKKAQPERLVESAKKVTKAMQCVSEASKKTSKVLANHGG
ncbi:MAG: hypothetical protein IPM04_13355 [Saprospiraceae bacterium]|nr:hypothetical protein [Candidatus Brachybacter algidus]MBK8748805.1 hypothetical protein [Candidatus Brachybacter algidus]